jgi:hypothetical protein
MPKSSLSALLVTGIVLCGPTQAASEPPCKPELAFKETRFSPIQAQQRIWTGVISVDASKCAAGFGRFALGFDRIIEYGPDLTFVEPFEWKPGEISVSFIFGYDEAPTNYWIADIAPCGCRN